MSDQHEQTVWQAEAPGRVNLIGEHTDYNGGFTLPLAIERWTKVVARLRPDGETRSRMVSQALNAEAWWTRDGAEYHPMGGGSAAEAPPAWSRYVAGVMNQFTENGHVLPPLDLHIETTVPLGGGVSSSASLEVAVAMVLQKVLGIQLDGLTIALWCQAAEHRYAGVPCGLMDQLSSVFGRHNQLMLIDCQSNQLEYIPADPAVAFVVINSGVKHELADGEYRQRRQQCEAACQAMAVPSLRDLTLEALEQRQNQEPMPEIVYRRARHVLTENQRTLAVAQALREADWVTAGLRMYESHASMRDDYEITCPEIDVLVEIARDLGLNAGVYGARMTGGGFGGCVVLLTTTHAAESLRRQVECQYLERTGRTAVSFVTAPAAGALQARSSADVGS